MIYRCRRCGVSDVKANALQGGSVISSQISYEWTLTNNEVILFPITTALDKDTSNLHKSALAWRSRIFNICSNIIIIAGSTWRSCSRLTNIIWPLQTHRNIIITFPISLHGFNNGHRSKVLNKKRMRFPHQTHWMPNTDREEKAPSRRQPDIWASTSPLSLPCSNDSKASWQVVKQLVVSASN